MVPRDKSTSYPSLPEFDNVESLERPMDAYMLEPQFYPDPLIFRASLEKLTKDDIELKKTLKSNKATLRVLAPYLRTIYTGHKKMIETARIKRVTKMKAIKTIGDKRFKHFIKYVPGLAEEFEVINAILETADVIKSLLKTSNVVSYMVNSSKGELYQNPRNIVSSMSKLSIKIGQGTTIAAYSAFTKDYVVSESVNADGRFPLGLGYPSTIYKYAMAVPVKKPDDDVVAIYELTRDAYDIAFSKNDVQVALVVASWMGVSIAQNDLYKSLTSERDVTDRLIQITELHHCGFVEFDKTLLEIVTFAKEFLGAEYGTSYVVEKETKGAFILEEYDLGTDSEDTYNKKQSRKTVESDDSVLSRVLFGKQSIKTCYENVELGSGGELVVRSILCVPICNGETVIGVLELINKRTEIEFNTKDEEIMERFATFCSININHFRANNNVNRSDWQNKVNQEMAFYHMKPCKRNQEALDTSKKSITVPDQFFTLGWSLAPDDIPNLAELSFCLFKEALGDSFMVSYDVSRFILTVQKCYRNNPYHNFRHAFYATHTMANIIVRYKDVFNCVEKRGLLIAAFCHNVDHQGQSNIFIDMTKHHLSDLYPSSTLQNHHFAVTRMIIKQCKLFKDLSSVLYDETLKEIYDNIVSTDSSLFFQFKSELKETSDKNLKFEDPTHRRLIKNFLMLACSLSDHTQPLALGKQTAEGIHEEMCRLGDIMASLGYETLPSMDRKNNLIAEERIQFFSVILLPCMQVVSKIFSAFSTIEENAIVMLRQWKEIILTKKEVVWNYEESIPNTSSTLIL